MGLLPDSAISKRQVSLLAHFPWLCFSSDPHYTFSLPRTHFYFSLSPNFFSGSVIGVFFFILVTLDLCLLLIHRDLWNSQKWQILISVNRDLNLFLIFCDSWPETPPPLFFKFSSMEKVFKIDLNLQTLFLQFSFVF